MFKKIIFPRIAKLYVATIMQFNRVQPARVMYINAT